MYSCSKALGEVFALGEAIALGEARALGEATALGEAIALGEASALGVLFWGLGTGQTFVALMMSGNPFVTPFLFYCKRCARINNHMYTVYVCHVSPASLIEV